MSRLWARAGAMDASWWRAKAALCATIAESMETRVSVPVNAGGGAEVGPLPGGSEGRRGWSLSSKSGEPTRVVSYQSLLSRAANCWASSDSFAETTSICPWASGT